MMLQKGITIEEQQAANCPIHSGLLSFYGYDRNRMVDVGRVVGRARAKELQCFMNITLTQESMNDEGISINFLLQYLYGL